MFNFNSKKIVEFPLSNDESIKYQLIKKSKKTLSLKITENGLIVSAPFYMTERKINQLISSKINWIKKKLALIEPQKKKNSLLKTALLLIYLEKRYNFPYSRVKIK